MNAQQAIEAIVALLDGDYDNPILMEYGGALHVNPMLDIEEIARSVVIIPDDDIDADWL